MASCRMQWVWLVNTLIILSVLVLLAVAHFNVVTFPKIGFYCGDPKISYQFNGDTIKMGPLFGVTLIVPLALMSLVECVRAWSLKGVNQALKWYGQFTFGLLMLVFVIEATKSIISEPRPHFLDTCRPNEAINCTSAYVIEYKCNNANATAYQLRDSIRSFPSGHSAIGFYTSIFLMIYLQERTPESTSLLVPWLQCMTFVWAVFCGLSRITDRRHHWWDVAIGAAVGLCSAVLVVQRVSRNFRTPEEGDGTTRKTFSTRRLLSSTSSSDSPPDEKLEKNIS